MTHYARIPADVRFRVVNKDSEGTEGAGRPSPRMSCQRRLVCLAAALVICLFVGTQAAAEPFTETFHFPDIPTFAIPGEPYVIEIGGFDEHWNIVEEHRDEIESATYERLRLSVGRAREAVETCERHAREFRRAYKLYESELKDLIEKRRRFDQRVEAVKRIGTADNQAHFDRLMAPLRAQYAPLRKQHDEFADRARGFKAWMENALEPEGKAAIRTLKSAFTEMAETIEQMRKYPLIGAAAAVSGSVTAQSPWPGSAARVLSSGMKVYLGDDVSTGLAGRMQILLLDETVFTVGPDTALTLDEFVFDPSQREGSLAATIAKGLIRFVSGQIAARQPEKVEVRLPVGTIGVRGTDFVVRIGAGGACDIDVLDGSVKFVAGRGGGSDLVHRGERLRVAADGTVRERTTIDVALVRSEWQAGDGSPPSESPDAEKVPPPFRPLHLWIAAAALLLLLVAVFVPSFHWLHLVPMLGLAFLFVICVDSTGRISVEGRWMTWWLGVASAGYILYVGIFRLALEIADGLAGLLRSVWPAAIAVGGVGAVAGLVLAFDGGETLYRFASQFVWPRTRFAPELTWVQPASGVQIMMFSAWAVAGAGILLLAAGMWTIRSAVVQRRRARRPPDPGLRQWVAARAQAEVDAKVDDTPCSACGKPLGIRRTSQCRRCRGVVHEITCLTSDLDSGGHMCVSCRREAAKPDDDPAEPGPEPPAPVQRPDESPAKSPKEPAPAREPATCPVCGEGFSGGRRSRCGECRRMVHRASCLGGSSVPAGRVCRACSGEEREEAPAAPPVGVRSSEAQCAQCETPVSTEDRFCRACGRPLVEDVPAAATDAPPLPPAPDPGAAAPVGAEEEAPPLTESERRSEVERALARLGKLGTAAVNQYALGNGRGYEHVQGQIEELGRHLRDKGGVALVDAVYGRFERSAEGAAVREVTLAFQSGIPDWSI